MDYEHEEKQYDYLAKEFKKPLPIVYSININGRRYYYEMLNGVPEIYASGTTLISDGYPDPSNAMEKWRLKMRMEGKDPDLFANYRASYGTVMHILFGDFLMGTKIPMEKLGDYIKAMKDSKISKFRLEELVDNNLDEFKKDLLSFAQFVKDYNVKPLAIEMMIRSAKYKVATAIDLVCKLDIPVTGYFGEVYKTSNSKTGIKAGDPKLSKGIKTIVALVDFKSGKKGFYDKHALQLLLNKQMMEENYPDLEIEAIFNFSPKEWKTVPSYNLKDQSENPVLNELDEVLSLGRKRHLKKSKKVKIFSGNLSLGSDFDFSNNFKTMELSDFIIENKIQNKDPFNKLLEDNDITSSIELRTFLFKLKMADLKEIGTKVGIQYTKKTDFIKKLVKKYLDGEGKEGI